MNYTKVTLEKKKQIFYLGFGKYEEKSLTVIYEQTLKEIDAALEEIKLDTDAKGLILFSHKADCFLAGMDVSVISGLTSESEASSGCERGQAVFNKLEDLKIPTIALVDGTCLGGGTEMILACDKIVVSDNPKTVLGLPEVMLGVLPGFGGTYRLPRKVGITNALDMILTGKKVRAKKALKIKLADYMVPKERLLSLGEKYLFEKKKDRTSYSEKITNTLMGSFVGKKIVFQKAREQVMKTTKGFYPAPLRILDHLEASLDDRRSRYLSREAKAFGELSQTKQSKNLQHIFFLQDQAKKSRSSENIIRIKQGAVLGAGTMGGGIAWLFADNDQSPIMKDINKEGLELGLKQAGSIFNKALKRRRISEDEFKRKQLSIKPQLDYSGFGKADLLVEAIVENMDLKKKIFKEVENQVSKDCLITSNTSSLSIEEMASALRDPERFAGLHFFNPVNKMPLVEIVQHSKTSEKTINSLYAWTLKVGKTPVVVKDCPGFLVNRILAPFLNESAYLLEAGVPIEQLDKAAENFGMPMGPCRLMDEVGIDVCSHVGEIMEEGLGERAKASSLSKRALKEDFLGKKNGKGFYLYDEAGKVKEVNDGMRKLISSDKKVMDETEIQKRIILPMINEASLILSEGIVDDAGTVDLGLIFGIGFPPFRGGLLKYADSEGISNIVTAMETYAKEVSSARYTPSKALSEMAKKGEHFY